MPDGDPDQRLYAHPACFKMWTVESRRDPVDPDRARRVRVRALVAALVAMLVPGLGGRRRGDSAR